MSDGPDDSAVAAAERVTAVIVQVAGSAVVGVYLHGSAVLGDFIPEVSDLDVLVVMDDGFDPIGLDAIGDALTAVDISPASGLELSIVLRSAAAAPRQPWPFVLHVATARSLPPRIVRGLTHDGDPDLILHVAVARAAGHAVVGPSPREVFGPIGDIVIVAQLAAELQWAAESAPPSYAVLNACRALRFCEDATICSKSDGGRWALERGVATSLVTAALDTRSGHAIDVLDDQEARAWVLSVADEILATLHARHERASWEARG